MAGINKVIIIGNLGNDIELKYTQNNDAIANLSIATSEKWTDKSGQTQERTEWHRVVMYRKLAEIAGQYLRKGSKVYIEGKLQTRKWQDNTGADRWSTEIVCNNMQMLDSRGSNVENNNTPADNNNNVATAANNENKTIPVEKNDDFEDDIPF